MSVISSCEISSPFKWVWIHLRPFKRPVPDRNLPRSGICILLLSPTITQAISPRRVIIRPICLLSSREMDAVSLIISLVAISWRDIFLLYSLESLFDWLDLRPVTLP
ncbi:MAG: hypothetical protein PVG39_25715 [Desulfobacteraceae bacterium]